MTAPTDAPATAPHRSHATAAGELPTASVRDTAAVVAEVLLPLAARGTIRRRPAVVRQLEAWDLDTRAVARLRALRDHYGAGPVRLRLPARELAVVLAPEDVPRILEGDPEPFAPANLEKRAALSHFQPEGVLASHGTERVERRRFNEAALESDRPEHSSAGHFQRVVEEETDALLELVDRLGGTLDWDDFLAAWYRIVRRVVLGDGARDDHRLTDDLAHLRDRANSAYLLPKDRTRRAQFLQRLAAHVERAEPGSLAASIAATPGAEEVDPVQQVPQWLFAFEPAGMAVYRALALAAAHPTRARAQLEAGGERSGVRGLVLESLRLWPTTPAILRDTTAPTTWRGATLPSGTGLLIFAPLFHRDEQRVQGADDFRPARWDDLPVDPLAEQPLVPFSGGPGVCPGRNVVLLTTATFLERLLGARWPVLEDPERLPTEGPLPSVLDMFTVRMTFPPRVAA